MFRLTLFLFFIGATSITSIASPYQTPDQKRISALEAQIKSLEKNLDQQKEELLNQQENDLTALKDALKKQQELINEQQKAIEEGLNPDYSYFYNKEKDTRFEGQAWLAFAFPLVFLALLTIMVELIRRSNYSLKKALSEIKIINNVGVTIESSSRLIAFISGSMALSIGLTLFVFGLFIYLKTGILPDFGILVNVLLALGIGVVPYTINKVAGAFKSNNT